MSDRPGYFNFSTEPALYQLFISIVIILSLGFVLLTISILAGKLIFGSDLAVLTRPTSVLTGNDAVFLRYLLIVQDFSFFIFPSIIILRLLGPEKKVWATSFKIPAIKEMTLVMILTLCLFPVTGFTAQLNSSIHLPSWLSGLDKWINEQEENAGYMIDSLLVTGSLAGLLFNIFIIAILPAVSEEILFRGVLQRIFIKLFRSEHIGIWIAAIFFSVIHFQFLGFIPRLILGLIFGYLFCWSQTIWLPVLAHFINNAFPVIINHTRMDKIHETPDISLWEQAIWLPFSITIVFLILFYFRNKSRNVPQATL